MKREVRQKELAQILGLTTRQIRNLEAAGMPHRAEGNTKWYPLPDTVIWYTERKVESALTEAQRTDYEEARAREMAARAEKAELEVAKMRGELIHVDDLERLLSAPLAQMRARLLALPGRIASALPMPPVDALEIIEPIVHEFMAELSEDDADEDEADDDA